MEQLCDRCYLCFVDTDYFFFLCQHAQKRILPSSFHSFASNSSSEHSTRHHNGTAFSQHKEIRNGKLSNTSKVDDSNVASYMTKTDSNLPQHTQKRVLPASLQQTMHKTTSEYTVDYNGDHHFCTFF